MLNFIKSSRVQLIAFVGLFSLVTFVFSGNVTSSSGNSLIIYALYYDPYLPGEPEEAFAIINIGNNSIDLVGWKVENRQRTVTFPSYLLASGDYIWATKTATAFIEEFGFSPEFEYGGDTDPNVPNMSGTPPNFFNTGGELLLRNPSDIVVDVLVYEGGNNNIQGWSGPSLEPYKQGDFGIEGQILYRKLDQATGLPVADTNTATDWAQYPYDDINGKKVRYPGWDLEDFFFTNIFTETANITYLVAPDNIYDGYLNIINQATSSIQIEGYSFTNANLADALIAKLQQEEVSVRILLEEEILGGTSDQQKWICQQIEWNGGECWFMFNDSGNGVHDRYEFQHAKFTIVDGKFILTGSENLSSSSMPDDDKGDGTWGNRGIVLVSDSPTLVGHAQDVFTRDLDPAHHKDIRRWNAAIDAPPVGFVPDYVTGGTGYEVAFQDPLDLTGSFNFEVVLSPDNALRSMDSLLGMVSRAGPGGIVYVEQLYERTYWGPSNSNPQKDPNPRLNAYIEAARRGATVRILLDSVFDYPSNPRNNWETCKYIHRQAVLEGLDMQCKLGNPTGSGIHNKMVLVWDGHQGWSHTGSINGSENSSKNNRELAVQVASNEAFTYLSNVFLHDWGNDIEPEIYLPVVLR